MAEINKKLFDFLRSKLSPEDLAIAIDLILKEARQREPWELPRLDLTVTQNGSNASKAAVRVAGTAVPHGLNYLHVTLKDGFVLSKKELAKGDYTLALEVPKPVGR